MSDISSIVEDVVHQFTDPLAFYRELVQNAVDSGTGEVEIELDYRVEDDGREGAAVATVRDYGVGMDRETIETRLCRLFSSAKYEDFTKIGRFGIGFVSVYGVEPDFVCVDTGRTGESWRVIFLPDRTYELYELKEPVEGTEVRVVKSMRPRDYEDFRVSSERVVRRWCKYVRIPVRFDGEDVREPFEIASPCAAEYEEEGTRLVCGFVEEETPRCGFYNQGLLLRESEHRTLPHFAFEIDSRFLDHTLTRDELLQNKNYHRVIELLDEYAYEILPRELLRQMERAAAREDLELLSRLHPLYAAMPYHYFYSLSVSVSMNPLHDGGRDLKPHLRPIFPTVGGEVLSSSEVGRPISRKRVWKSSVRSRLARAVSDAGYLVLLALTGEGTPADRMHGEPIPDVEDDFVLLEPDRGRREADASLLAAMQKLLMHADISAEDVWLGRWDDGDAVAVWTADPHGPRKRKSLNGARQLQTEGLHLVLNEEADLVGAALELSERAPMLAAATLLAYVRPRLTAKFAGYAARHQTGGDA